jgi:hypothetical protein
MRVNILVYFIKLRFYIRNLKLVLKFLLKNTNIIEDPLKGAFIAFINRLI